MALKTEMKYESTTDKHKMVFSYNTADTTNDIEIFKRIVALLAIPTNKAVFEVVVNPNGTTQTTLKIVAI